MQNKIFYAGGFGFGLGVLVRSFIAINFYFTIFLGILVGIILLFSYFAKLKWGMIAGLFVIFAALGVARFHISDVEVPVVSEDSEPALTGIIVDDPDIRETNQKLTVEIEDGTKILVTTNFGQDFEYGDEVKIEGELKLPENFITDQGKEFDYVNYLKKDGIYYVMNYVNVEVTSQGNANFVKSALFKFKNKLLEQVNYSIYSPENLLMGGLILGERSPFSQELRESFVRTGTIHIVALSGYNITIVAEWFMKIFSFLPIAWATGTGIFAILLFILMTGASSTAVRAGIMATLVLIARITGRNYDALRGLVLAGVVMLFFNPYLLVYDVSFQLSFLATVAVIFFTPKIEKYFQWITKSFGLREVVALTASAYIFVLPFILYKMGNLSLVALPTNALVLPFIPFTMMLGFITSILGVIWSPLAVPGGLLSYLFLHYELKVIEFFSNLPFASFAFANFPLVLTLAIYAYFVHLLFGGNIKKFFEEI